MVARKKTSSAKTYYRQDNIGTAKYTVSYHDGVKRHRDGSPFYDIAIFRNKNKMLSFIGKLRAAGYRSLW